MITKSSNFMAVFLKELPLFLSLFSCIFFVSCKNETGLNRINKSDKATSQSKPQKNKKLEGSVESRLGEFFIEKKIRKNSNFAETL